jgi:hypothetical protein
MPRKGIATLPLHYGKAPRWLFERMVKLSREILIALVTEFGPYEVLNKLSDPYWFQALGCVLGFDWHSSGVTTTVTGALKEAIKGIENELGLFIAGGKGGTSRKTPEEIKIFSERTSLEPGPLVYASKMSAKVDNTAVQDGYQLYHHVFIFTHDGKWAVVQQGMNTENRTARRYHWLGSDVESFVVEPHRAVCCNRRVETLNMVATESEQARNITTRIACEKPEKIIKEINRVIALNLPQRHKVTREDINPDKIHKTLIKTYESQPGDFEKLLSINGVGPKTIRALSLVSEIIYGAPPSYRDPARFSFAHGGKDGTPYPVDKKTYDKTIEVIRVAINSSRLGNREQMDAIRRLSIFYDF